MLSAFFMASVHTSLGFRPPSPQSKRTTYHYNSLVVVPVTLSGVALPNLIS
ncbi:hypothetical protein [Yersinia intermedia]|uniref:hypothetical protein n=1 Tax=Yersinia intermedia TaxID=631 RepID=UPI001643F1B3|nr:hypothetical protein [Yersinia intermedia]